MEDLTFLSQEDLVNVGLLDFKLAQRAVEKGLVWHSTGKSRSGKVALVLDLPEEWKFNGLVAVNGSYSAMKYVGSRTTNKAIGLPRTIATIVLADKSTGVPLAMMEGAAISAIRTGCYAAVGLRYLGHQDRPNNVGIIGSSVMAKASLQAMVENYGQMIGDVFVYSKTRENREAFAKEASERFGIEVYALDNSRDVVRNSDVSITAITRDDEILVRDDDAREGATHIHIGGWGIDQKYTVRAAKEGKSYCDDWCAIKKRRELILSKAFYEDKISEKDIYGDIGSVINGSLPGREGLEPIHFYTVGLGELDLVMASELYEKAKEKGIGQKLKLWENDPVWLLQGY